MQKKKQIVMQKKVGEFTHFLSVPFINNFARDQLRNYQNQILHCFKKYQTKALIRNNPNLFHISLSMLCLNAETRPKTIVVLQKLKQSLIQNLSGVKLSFSKLNFFKRGHSKNPYDGVTILYLEILEDQNYIRLMKSVDLLIRELIKDEVVIPNELRSMNINYDHNSGLYRLDKMHVTMFRIDQKLSHDVDFQTALKLTDQVKVEFKLQIESVDVSTRFSFDESKYYTPLCRLILKK